MRCILVNGAKLKADSYCCCCRKPIGDNYVREIATRRIYYHRDCYSSAVGAPLVSLQYRAAHRGDKSKSGFDYARRRQVARHQRTWWRNERCNTQPFAVFQLVCRELKTMAAPRSGTTQLSPISIGLPAELPFSAAVSLLTLFMASMASASRPHRSRRAESSCAYVFAAVAAKAKITDAPTAERQRVLPPWAQGEPSCR